MSRTVSFIHTDLFCRTTACPVTKRTTYVPLWVYGAKQISSSSLSHQKLSWSHYDIVEKL